MAASIPADFARLTISQSAGIAAAPTAAVVGNLRSRQVIDLLTNAEAGPLLPPLAALIDAYMQLPIRSDFERSQCCSQETLEDLVQEGATLQAIDLSGLVLGTRNPRCVDPEFDEHLDDQDVHTCLSTADPAPFTALFSRCPKLTTLNLAGCNINDAVVATLPQSLQVLDLSGNKAISCAGIQHIAQLQEIHTLSLRGMARDRNDADTNICFFGCSMDSDARAHKRGIVFIKQLTKLVTLDLSENYLEGGTTYLDTDLQLESCLPELVVCMNTIHTLQKIILNKCSDLFLEQIEKLRAQRPRASIEIVSDAVSLEAALAQEMQPAEG